MARTITVKGTGKYKASPDCTEIRLDIETVEKEYGSALENENGKIAKLTDAVISAGLKEEDLKTESFNVNTEYKSVETKSGRYESVFAGYRVSHSLVLRFDFDPDKLSEVITAISCSGVQPGMNIGFTVKDKDAASEAMLKSAVENARRNADVLCASSGVTLGDLLSIDYSWGEISLYSPTRYEADLAPRGNGALKCMSFVPDDVETSDTVTFVWEIKE